MAERTITTRTYVTVCVLLILLTFLTVGVSFMPVQGRWHIIIGLAIAAGKGSLVVLFFMHALISPRLTWVVIVVTGFWLSLLLVLTLCDYFSRGLVPHMPGHCQRWREGTMPAPTASHSPWVGLGMTSCERLFSW
jgi:cytochrome c oxidase subunit IV